MTVGRMVRTGTKRLRIGWQGPWEVETTNARLCSQMPVHSSFPESSQRPHERYHYPISQGLADNKTQVCLVPMQATVSVLIPYLMCFHMRPDESNIIFAKGPLGYSLQLSNLKVIAPLHQPAPWGLARSSQAVSKEASFPSSTVLDPDHWV